MYNGRKGKQKAALSAERLSRMLLAVGGPKDQGLLLCHRWLEAPLLGPSWHVDHLLHAGVGDASEGFGAMVRAACVLPAGVDDASEDRGAPQCPHSKGGLLLGRSSHVAEVSWFVFRG